MKSDAIREKHRTLWRGSGLAMPSLCDVGLLSHIYTHAHTDVYRLTYGNMHAAQTHLQ